MWGSRALWVPPQTSTIASHLPKATGLAFSLARARRMGMSAEVPSDAIVLASFGDASANHATALAGINTARYAARLGLPLPDPLRCARTTAPASACRPRPAGSRESFGNLPHLRYVLADGELDEVWARQPKRPSTRSAARASRRSCTCPPCALWGHAGLGRRARRTGTAAEIAAIEAQDPLLRTARRLVETGAATPRRAARDRP